MLYTFRKTSTTPGTPVALRSSRTPASWCTVQAINNNTKPVYIGGVNPDTKAVAVQNASGGAGTYVGHRLIVLGVAGDTVDSTFLNLRELGGATYLDLSKVYLDVDSSGDGVEVTFGVR